MSPLSDPVRIKGSRTGDTIGRSDGGSARLPRSCTGWRAAPPGHREHADVVIAVWAGIGASVGGVGAVVVWGGPWWAASLVHYAVPYVLLLALLGSTSPRPRVAAGRSIACFIAFVFAYYAVVALQFGAIPVPYAAAWAGTAITVCPAAAAAIRWAVGRRGLLPAFVFAATGAVALSDGSLGNLIRVAIGRLDPHDLQPALVVTAVIGLLVATGAVVLLPRDGGTRIAAGLLLVPLGALATFVGWAVHFGAGPYL